MTRRTHTKVRTALGAGLTTAALLTSGLAGTADAALAGSGHAVGRVAAAGTITYILNNNVWVANTDGSGARQVTSGGTATDPWYSPTESDAGQIVAGRGNLIYRMDQWGHVFNTIDPPDLVSGGNEKLGGRMSSIAVSPNGATIAYAYSKDYCSFPNNVCRIWPVTGFTASQKLTNGGSTYGQTPAWVTNSRVSLDSRSGFDNLYLHDVGVGDVATYWFDDANIHTDDLDLFDLEVSLGTPFGVGVRGKLDQARIAFYDFRNVGNYQAGMPSPAVTQMFETSTVLGIGSPTISSDGALAAWQEPDGVWTFGMDGAAQPALTVGGASAPALSRAALQSTRPTYPAEPFATKAAPKVKGSAKVGKKLKAAAPVLQPKPTSLRYQWLRDKKVIKGAKKATYKVSRKDRGHQLRVRVVAARKGFVTKTVTSKAVRVKK